MIARRFTPPEQPCLKEKSRRNDFQNVSFVLSGRLSAEVARAVPSLIQAPAAGGAEPCLCGAPDGLKIQRRYAWGCCQLL
jgi:hypothetical protein